MVLKVCTRSHTTWISDVEEVRLDKSFHIPKDAAIRDPLHWAYPTSDEDKSKNWKGHSWSFHVAEFAPEDEHGSVVVLTRQRREFEVDWNQVWIVPCGSTFLMEKGETIDRI